VEELVPLSPQWWVKRLYDELQARQSDMQLHRDLVDDEHMPANTAEKSAKFRMMAGLSTTNLCGLVVEATAERMEVEGFRFGDNPDSDADAWGIWQNSDFDAGSAESITHALVYGRSFVSVDPNGPRLLGEDPRQVIVAYSSDGRRDRLAALKVFVDEWTGGKFATLYLPTVVYRFRDGQSNTSAPPLWLPREIPGLADQDRNPLGEVPFFELRNRPMGRTRSEIANLVIPQRRLNQAVFNTDAVAEYGAFRQKWATGIEVPRDPVTGLPVSPYEAHVTKLFVADGEAKFGDFNATDLNGYLKLGQEIAAHIARISRVPITYFLTDVSNISADALALLVSGLVKKCQRRVKGYEPAFEGAMRLAFKAMGDARALEMNAETRWASMETRSVAQDADAAVKLTQGENPVITPQTAQEKYLGMSQTERDRDNAWRLENGAGASLAGLLSADEFATNQPA
jgi:Phage portal protein, SPP1 Gp6-like